MESRQNAIVDRFARLPGAMRIPMPKLSSDAVFIPGTRKRRVLLVAHCDTVWESEWIRTRMDGDKIISADKNTGIGADDRAGCAALWLLRKTGHSLLIVPDEEIGCRGSSLFADKHYDLLQSHRFMLQFDRCGDNDIVTYDCANDEFNDFLVTNLPGFRPARGSFTDIGVLMEPAGIAGANLSIGYECEHTPYEEQSVSAFIRTVSLVRQMLTQVRPPYFRYIDGWYKRQTRRTKVSDWNRTQRHLDAAWWNSYSDDDGWGEDFEMFEVLAKAEREVSRDIEGGWWWCDTCARAYDTDGEVDWITDEPRCPCCWEIVQPHGNHEDTPPFDPTEIDPDLLDEQAWKAYCDWSQEQAHV